MIPSARRRIAALLILAALAGCQGARPAASSTAAAASLSPAELALACAHDPRARLRLYGCHRPHYGLLLVVDGVPVPLPADTASLWVVRRDSVFTAMRGRIIDSVHFVPPDSARQRYGSYAERGALLFWTRRP